MAPWRNDDYFYHAQGVAHVVHHLALALQAEYRQDLAARPTVQTLLKEVGDSLGEAATMLQRAIAKSVGRDVLDLEATAC